MSREVKTLINLLDLFRFDGSFSHLTVSKFSEADIKKTACQSKLVFHMRSNISQFELSMENGVLTVRAS